MLVAALALASLALLAAAPVLAAWRAPHPETGTFAGLLEELERLDAESTDEVPAAA